MPVPDSDLVCQLVVEVRYRPFGSLIDYRGRIADRVAEKMGLSFWSISENRVDFKNSEASDDERAFVSHRHLGYQVWHPATRNFLPDRASKFIRELTQIDGFELTPLVRLGVRFKVLFPSKDNFGDLLERVNEHIPVPKNLVQPFNATVKEEVDPETWTAA